MDKNAFLIELSESDRTDFGRVDFADQPEEQKVFSAIWELEGQVNNGGFAQYFANSDRHAASFAPLALRRIGAAKCADVVARALAVVSTQILPEERETPEGLVDALDDAAQAALQPLDEEFFTYPDDLTELLFDYVRSNPRTFGTIGRE